MITYASTRGSIEPVAFDEAVLGGFAADGGLFVPTEIPVFSAAELREMAGLGYPALAGRIIRRFIDPSIIPEDDLHDLLTRSFEDFTAENIIPVVQLGQSRIHIQELFHGPTLSFKDVAMGFLVNSMDYFLTKRGEHLSLILATTGDTGPAAAQASTAATATAPWGSRRYS